MQRRNDLLAGIMVVLVACSAGQAIAAEDAADPIYLGRPVSYWVGRAGRASGADERACVVDALVAALEDKEPSVRVAAGDALGSCGEENRRAIDALVGVLADPSAWVRTAAMETLGKIGSPAVPALLGTFEDGPPVVGVRAGIVLRDIGQAARAELEKAARSDSEKIRKAAALAIEQIEADTAAAAARRATVDAAALAGPIISDTPDWPQFHGPGRDNLCREKGLLQAWPEGGPTLLWSLVGLGRGYSSVSIAGGRLLTMGDRVDADGRESQYVIAYDPATRKQLWATRIGEPHEEGGPRCTPTIDGDLVYAIGTGGNLLCAEAATGRMRWQRQLAGELGGRMMSSWKYSESPLVDGDKLVCTPGAPDAMLAAFDKSTGELVWKTTMPEIGAKGEDGAAYASMVAAEIAGRRQYVQIVGRGVIGVDAETGKFLWGYNAIANKTAHITMPVIRGDYVFATTSYRTGSVMLKIVRQGERFTPEEVYVLTARDFENHHGGIVAVGEYLYGGHGLNQGTPVCLKLTTGEIAWKAKAPERGSAAVLYADGRLIFRYDRGPVYLVEATEKEFRITGHFEPPTDEGPAWPHPVIHDGKLYLRHADLLLCYDVRASRPAP